MTSHTQALALHDFLAGAMAVETASRDGSTTPARLENSHAATLRLKDGHRVEEWELEGETIPVYEFPNHQVTRVFGDFTSDFFIKPSAKLLARLPESERETMKDVLIYSAFVATGERVPALIVPEALRADVEALMQKMQLRPLPAEERTNPYDAAHYAVETDTRADGARIARFEFGWEALNKLSMNLNAGFSRAAEGKRA